MKQMRLAALLMGNINKYERVVEQVYGEKNEEEIEKEEGEITDEEVD